MTKCPVLRALLVYHQPWTHPGNSQHAKIQYPAKTSLWNVDEILFKTNKSWENLSPENLHNNDEKEFLHKKNTTQKYESIQRNEEH